MKTTDLNELPTTDAVLGLLWWLNAVLASDSDPRKVNPLSDASNMMATR